MPSADVPAARYMYDDTRTRTRYSYVRFDERSAVGLNLIVIILLLSQQASRLAKHLLARSAVYARYARQRRPQAEALLRCVAW